MSDSIEFTVDFKSTLDGIDLGKAQPKPAKKRPRRKHDIRLLQDHRRYDTGVTGFEGEELKNFKNSTMTNVLEQLNKINKRLDDIDLGAEGRFMSDVLVKKAIMKLKEQGLLDKILEERGLAGSKWGEKILEKELLKASTGKNRKLLEKMLNTPQIDISIPDKILGKIQNTESHIRPFRTATQRLNVFGLWFLGSAQLNPSYTVAKLFLNSLHRLGGPAGAALTTAITAIASAGPVIEQTIKTLGQKGGPLNQDWRRSIETETTGMFTLEEQKRRDLGLDGYIVSSDIGFQPISDTSVYNSQLARDEIRLNKLTQEEKVRNYK